MYHIINHYHDFHSFQSQSSLKPLTRTPQPRSKKSGVLQSVWRQQNRNYYDTYSKKLCYLVLLCCKFNQGLLYQVLVFLLACWLDLNR